MKLFIAGLIAESTDLTPVPTTEDDWNIVYPGDSAERRTRFSDMLSLFNQMAKAKGWQVFEGPCASAMPPGGRSTQAVYEKLRARILRELQKAMPVDGVLLQLHGAMMAYGYDDCEGDLLFHIREVVGPDVPIGAELDPHCHMTKQMVNNATLLILYKTYVHTDIEARALELFDLTAQAMEGFIKPVMALFDCKMVDWFDEEYEPVKSFHQQVYKREKEPGVLSISPVHGYSYADVPEMGSKLLVVTDNDISLAQKQAEELGMEFFRTRGQYAKSLSVSCALDQAQERSGKGMSAIKFIEWSDSAGCGFPTDGTELLQAMIHRGMTDVAVGLIWDPQSVSICHQVGEGSQLWIRIGGKVSTLSGVPLDLYVRVERIYKDIAITNWGGEDNPCDAAVVSSGDIELLLTTKRILGTGLQPFEDLGVDPVSKQYLLLKYHYGYESSDEENAAIVVFGQRAEHLSWPFEKIDRHKYPWVDNPFT